MKLYENENRGAKIKIYMYFLAKLFTIFYTELNQ